MILATRRGNTQLRAFTSSMSNPPSRIGGNYAVGQVRVTADTVAGLPAVDAAINGASQALACLTLGVWRGRRTERKAVTTTWQARLFASARPNPCQTWFEFWETAEASMTARRNAFIWRTVADGRVVALWALHPDQVFCDPTADDGYRVALGCGWLDPTELARGPRPQFTSVGEDVILHGKGPGGGARHMAPTPVELFRASLGAALAQVQYQEGFYTRGVGDGLVLSFPAETTEPQAEAARRQWEASAAGLRNAHGTRVVSGGASITQVGVSQRDAQFIESQRMSIEDAARVFQWPASLLGGSAGIGSGAGPISPEHELTRMVRYCLLPRMARWEAILMADPFLFGDGARDYPEWDREGLIRADVATQTSADAQNVNAGILLVDEVRAERGLPPLPNGAGQVPQITPVGGAPNAHQEPPGEAPDPEGPADAATEPPTT
mgnify:CR=1 FL=1